MAPSFDLVGKAVDVYAVVEFVCFGSAVEISEKEMKFSVVFKFALLI